MTMVMMMMTIIIIIIILIIAIDNVLNEQNSHRQAEEDEYVKQEVHRDLHILLCGGSL